MFQKGCDQCRILLDEAGKAISSHAKAIGELAAAVGRSSDVASLEAAIRTTGAAREIAVEHYENHKSRHQLKVMSAGSGYVE